MAIGDLRRVGGVWVASQIQIRLQEADLDPLESRYISGSYSVCFLEVISSQSRKNGCKFCCLPNAEGLKYGWASQ
jgi:hypothetical protein